MDMNVNLITGRQIHLSFNQPCPHEFILEELSRQTELLPNKLMLVKNGEVIKEMNSHAIEGPGDIWLVPRVRAGVQLHIRLFSGVILSVEVDLDEDTIFNLKEKISEKNGIETSDQILIFKERSLNDDELKLSSAGIQKGDMLNLTLKNNDASVKVEPKESSCCCFL
eukprot:TRINITY_DN18799_c0_g1_i1.p1 TRINITY_DN18799_c0_g1~~TRINITY_DN18799_c0_g1_i1.p1  ORF type:complete len:167 (-),score=17.35 TRINITY_DN18799_c0_g1_i1:28-528(-)